KGFSMLALLALHLVGLLAQGAGAAAASSTWTDKEVLISGRALRMAAQAGDHAQNVLGAFYRRIQARAGAPKAIVATAHKLAERVYRLLRYGEEYVRQDVTAYEAA